LKKAAAQANHASKRLGDRQYQLIVETCDEILAGQHQDMFPLHVWMTGSGTQFNMNVERGDLQPLAASSRARCWEARRRSTRTTTSTWRSRRNDSFPSAMYVAAAMNVKQRLVPAVKALHDAILAKSKEWGDNRQDRSHAHAGRHAAHPGPGVVRLRGDAGGRSGTDRRGAPGRVTAGAGWYKRWEQHQLGAGIAEAAAANIAALTGLPFVTAPNKFTVQGAHDALVQLSGTLRTLAVSLYKIGNDIRPDVVRTSCRICRTGDSGK